MEPYHNRHRALSERQYIWIKRIRRMLDAGCVQVFHHVYVLKKKLLLLMLFKILIQV